MDCVVVAIQHLATVAALRGETLRAARLVGFVDAWYRSEGREREQTERRTYEILMAALRERLTDSEIDAAAVEGSKLTEGQAIDEALAI